VIDIGARPSMDRTLLNIAQVMSHRGTCARAQVGAVFALEGRVLSTGYNGAPAGLAHCVHVSEPLDATVDRTNDPGCVLAVHAEANAVAFAAKHGVSLAGATLYTTLSPCLACAQLLINVGVKRVVADLAYRRVDGLELLRSAAVVVEVSGRRWKPVKV
jgi:dCMP deaminase